MPDEASRRAIGQVTRSRFYGSELSIRWDLNAGRSLSEAFDGQGASLGELTDVDGCISDVSSCIIVGEACYLWGHHKSSVTLFFLSLLLTHDSLLDGLLLGKQQVARVYHQPRSRHTYLISTE